MSNQGLDNTSVQPFAGLSLHLATAESSGNLLADTHGATVLDGGQPKLIAQVAASPEQAAPPAAAKPDQQATGVDASQTAPVASQQILDMLAQAKQVKANVVMPGQVVMIDDLNFNRDPAWNPHAIQKGPVDTIDDILLDKQGSFTVNPNKLKSTVTLGTVSIGIEADAVHWSPLFLPTAQEESIRDAVEYLKTTNPQVQVPGPLTDVPWKCLESPQQGPPPSVDPAMFQKLLDMHKLSDRIVAAVASNEGNITTVVTNDAGAGFSVGMREWNQHVGELPTLLKAMYDNDPCTFVRDFGPYASKLINNVSDPAKATINESFVRKADFPALLGFTDASHKHVAHIPDLQRALSDFQNVQVALSRQWVIGSIDLAKKYGFTSELGWAEVCDVVNQKGAGGTERTLNLIPKAGKATEAARIQALETAVHRPGGQTRLSNLEKKFKATTIATLDPPPTKPNVPPTS